MKKREATYQYLEEAHGNGMFFFTSCCGNRMYSVDNNPMKYHGCLCPKCFWNNELVTLYLRGTTDGIRVFETEHVAIAEGEDERKNKDRMTREELKAHCERQIKMCDFKAIGKGEKPSGKIYEEHKLILELLEREPSRDMEEIAEVIKSDADAETKCKMISNILTAKSHYFEESQESKEKLWINV